ncbi:zinc metalloproteinase nas-4 [Lingula anatina]|uniref:Metalloendopeptidase n=1 Tax=Lingula anatina TaxID=7574 RepID=A0A1S3KHL5_LINAN|nr:zinc metalloproteinase nas-4 [Lingula anatina]|eukprot:XP_013421716.1 zinc metalloproteinase nas-4 [Lingula anatina]
MPLQLAVRGGPTVRYLTSSAASYTSSQKSFITDAMREIEEKTKVGSTNCVRFVARSSQPDYISIKPLTGCYSGVGKKSRGGSQDLSLARGCMNKGVIMHELLHTLGFHHEQSRADRDNYVTIHWDNIKDGKSSNFKKYELGYIQHLTNYDYGSIMHYGRYGFAADRTKPTITPKRDGATIGQRVALSTSDISEIRQFYNCGGSGSTNTATTSKPVTQKPVTQQPGTYLSFCNFDSGSLCGWTQDSSDDINWTLKSGATSSADTGPSSGYGGSGKYMYVEASGKSAGAVARLLSPRISHPGGSQQYCVTVSYHMYGNTMGNLMIGTKLGSSFKTMYTLKGEKGNSWRNMRLTTTISYSGSSLQFFFAGERGSGVRSDIAIDNVKISRGRC